MAMRSSTVRGTPVHHIDARGGEGQRGGEKPNGMVGTVHEQYDSDRRGYQSDPRGGTPFNSERGNPPGARREVARGTNLESADHGNQNDPHSNGQSVMLDTHGYERGYMPKEEGGVMDSPVPGHAARFDTTTVHEEDRAHLGTGLEDLAGKNNDLRDLDGVMSRGIMGTSKPTAPEKELIEDDDRPETAGAQEHRREERE